MQGAGYFEWFNSDFRCGIMQSGLRLCEITDAMGSYMREEKIRERDSGEKTEQVGCKNSQFCCCWSLDAISDGFLLQIHALIFQLFMTRIL